MIRILLTCVLAAATAWAQTATSAPQNSQPQAVPLGVPKPQQIVSPADLLPPDAVVITIHGLCPESKGGKAANPASCETKITKEQFNQIVTAININGQSLNAVARRSLAESYLRLMALADAGQAVGIDKDTQFEQLMKVVRTRTLGDAYRRFLEAKYSNPSPEAIEPYY